LPTKGDPSSAALTAIRAAGHCSCLTANWCTRRLSLADSFGGLPVPTFRSGPSPFRNLLIFRAIVLKGILVILWTSWGLLKASSYYTWSLCLFVMFLDIFDTSLAKFFIKIEFIHLFSALSLRLIFCVNIL
jgi:hypothetical protein